MQKKRFIKKEVDLLNFLLLATGKVLIGIGIGIAIANHVFYLQPYWYLLVVAGAIILFLTLYGLMNVEKSEELYLLKKL